MIPWTPYSVAALAQVFADQFSVSNPWLMTTCAVLAKLSIILKGHDMAPNMTSLLQWSFFIILKKYGVYNEKHTDLYIFDAPSK
jgi:hypothetical protein